MNSIATLSPLIPCINVKLALLGFQPAATNDGAAYGELVSTLVAQYREKERLLATHLSPADQRIQTFLYDYLQDVPVTKLPAAHVDPGPPGHGALLSLPVDRDEFASSILNSYRVKQGVLHNPKQRPPHDAGNFPRHRRRLADSGRQNRRARKHVRQNARARASIRRAK